MNLVGRQNVRSISVNQIKRLGQKSLTRILGNRDINRR